MTPQEFHEAWMCKRCHTLYRIDVPTKRDTCPKCEASLEKHESYRWGFDDAIDKCVALFDANSRAGKYAINKIRALAKLGADKMGEK